MYKDKDVNVAHVRFLFRSNFARFGMCDPGFFFAKQMKVFYTKEEDEEKS